MEGTIGSFVDLAPAVQVLLQMLAGLLLAVGTWGVKRISDRFGIEVDDKIRGYLMSAVSGAVGFGIRKAKALIEEKPGWTRIQVENAIVASAASYILSKVPDAVKRFNLTEEDIRDLILAKLDMLNVDEAALIEDHSGDSAAATETAEG